jgi:hypothetical protein
MSIGFLFMPIRMELENNNEPEKQEVISKEEGRWNIPYRQG